MPQLPHAPPPHDSLHDLLGPCPPLNFTAHPLSGIGGDLGGLGYPAGGPAEDILGPSLADSGRDVRMGHASMLGRRKRCEDGDQYPGDPGVHAESPRPRFFEQPAAAGVSIVKREPVRSLFACGPVMGPADPGQAPSMSDVTAAAGRTPPPVEGGLCKRRRTSSHESPQLSVELMRFGSQGGAGLNPGLNPALAVGGYAGGYARFHGPHEAEDRGLLAQALSRHMSGQVPAQCLLPAAPLKPEEEVDDEETVRGGSQGAGRRPRNCCLGSACL